MNYEIEFNSQPKKFIKKLQKDIALRILNKFEEVSKNPFRYLEHYEGENCFKLRVGVYRALIDVDFAGKKLIIRVIDKRGRIYR